MRWARWVFFLTIFGVIGSVLHYTLPKRDILRVTNTEIIRQDFSGLNRMFYAQGDSGNATVESRDLRLINTVAPDGSIHVFRNEDTGFGWPPYFKINSADLQAEASNLVSTAAAPQWVAVTHYGWRSRLLTTYPNAVTLRAVDGPDVRLIPWVPIVILILLAGVVFMAWRIWERFEDRVIDPMRDRLALLRARLRK